MIGIVIKEYVEKLFYISMGVFYIGTCRSREAWKYTRKNWFSSHKYLQLEEMFPRIPARRYGRVFSRQKYNNSMDEIEHITREERYRRTRN